MAKPGRPSPGLDDYLYWQERLANREASGLSIDEFCVDEGVSRTTFYRWVQRLKEGIPDAVQEAGASLTLAEIAEPKFLPVSVMASPVEIELPMRVVPPGGCRPSRDCGVIKRRSGTRKPVRPSACESVCTCHQDEFASIV
jgi:hypothetical protein